MQKWRFIDTGTLSGPENMAFDEALLKSFDPQSSLPILRIYGWSSPTLSLGRFQKAAEVLKLDECRVAGIPVVRRISGGGVLYHCNELTYSLVCSPNHISDSDSIKETYRTITGFLLRFYRKLGLNADYAVDCVVNKETLGERTSFCFAGKEQFDILVNGKKIGGNAQRRLKNVIFQHGSIPLINSFQQVTAYVREDLFSLDDQVTSLSSEHINFNNKILAGIISNEFCNNFNAELIDYSINAEEQEMFSLLLKNRYLSDRWNLEGEV